MALNRAQVALNLIRTMGSDAYKNSVPALTEETPISTVWGVFTSQPLVYKEFTQLFGAFMELEVMKNRWDNPLGELIVSGSPLGEFSAVVGSNPATPRPYDPAHPERVLQYAMSDDKVVYYTRNIKEFFKVSFAYEDMKGAFQSYGKFDEYMSMKMATLESGKNISSYNHMMESLVVNYYAGVFVESDIHISPETTNFGPWTTAVKTAYDEMLFPSYKYNKYGNLEGANGPFKAWSKPEDIFILTTIGWMNTVDVEFLAAKFNLEKAEIAKRIIKVPEFGYDVHDNEGNFVTHITSPIEAVVIDRRALKFKNDLDLDTSFFNDETLVSNYWKHFWATYQINPLAQVLVFTRPISNSTEQNTNFYIAQYNRPSITTVKNTGNTAITNISIPTAARLITLKGANGEVISTDATSDTAFTAEDFDENNVPTSNKVAALCMMLSTLVNSTSAKFGDVDVSLVNFEVTPLTIAAGDSINLFELNRTNSTNHYKAGEVTISMGEDSLTYNITEELLENIKAAYGNNLYIELPLEFTPENTIDPVTISVGVKNK